jgi:hypothetical protein
MFLCIFLDIGISFSRQSSRRAPPYIFREHQRPLTQLTSAVNDNIAYLNCAYGIVMCGVAIAFAVKDTTNFYGPDRLNILSNFMGQVTRNARCNAAGTRFDLDPAAFFLSYSNANRPFKAPQSFLLWKFGTARRRALAFIRFTGGQRDLVSGLKKKLTSVDRM